MRGIGRRVVLALRGTLTHWKTRTLAESLGISPAHALGLLESLWHTTAEDAPNGNIGRLSNKAIAMQMFTDIDPDRLIAALVSSGHLDEHPEHRLVTHDWDKHADDAVNMRLARAGQLFANGSQPSTKRLSKHERATLCARRAHDERTCVHKSAPPEPEPVPEPEPEKVSEAKASSPRRDADGDSKPAPELIYGEYPRKEGHRVALVAIEKAIGRIRKGEGAIPPLPDLREAQVYLYRRTQCYARSPAGARADKTLIPHPATWYNQSRYLDDESNWQLTGGEGHGQPTLNRAQQRTNGNLSAREAAIAAITGRGPADHSGRGSAGFSEPANVPALLLRTGSFPN